MAEDHETLSSGAVERVIRVLDFLREVHAMRYPPVRDIAKHGLFRLTEENLPDHPVVELTAGSDSWLTVRLVDRPDAPALPDELTDAVSDFSHHQPPVLLEHDDDRELLLEIWIEEEWQPWAEECRLVERTRDLFKDLFDVRNRLTLDRDTLELRWGFSKLRWSLNGMAIDHPMITVGVDVVYDERRAEVRVVPVGQPELEVEYLADVDLADRSGLSVQAERLREFPLDVWDRTSIEKSTMLALRAISQDGVWAKGRTSPTGPMVEPGWVLFMRRRPLAYKGFLQHLKDAVQGGGELSAALAAVVVDEPSRLPVDDPTSWRASGDRLLLPLPTNEEQQRVLERVIASNGVTVQGPPGTGKSHTIANLVCHFVACGKRVLVTAEKEQALAVLAEKLPADVRDLCVSVIGTDSDARSGLEHTIRSIHEEAFRLDDRAATRDIERLEAELDELERRRARLERRIRDAAAFEGTPPDGETDLPLELAKWLLDTQDELGFIPDELEWESVSPLDADEAVHLWSLIDQFEPKDISAAQLSLPDPTALPGRAELEDRAKRIMEICDEVVRVADVVSDPQRSDALTIDELDRLIAHVDAVASWRLSVESSWLREVEGELSIPHLSATWPPFIQAVETELGRLRDLSIANQGHDVRLPTEDRLTIAERSTVERALHRLAQGKKLTRVRHRAEIGLLERMTVDGERPSTVEHLELCLRESDRREVMARLQLRWNQQMARVGGPVVDEMVRVERVVSVEIELLKPLLSAGETHRSTIAELQAAGLLVVDNPTSADLQKYATALRALRLRREQQSLERWFDGVRERLRTGAQLPDASPLWSQLIAALDERDYDRWVAILTECQRLLTIRPNAQKVSHLLGRLSESAPEWVERIVQTRADRTCGDPTKIHAAWRWRRLDCYLRSQRDAADGSDIEQELAIATRQRARTMAELVSVSAKRELARQFTDAKRQALTAWLEANKRYGKGTGRYAARYEAAARDAMDRAKDAVPVWIMSKASVIRNFTPGKEPPFDVLIIDEASQCGLLDIPLFGLARKVVVVGDDKQTSPENVGTYRAPVHDLIDQLLWDLPNRETVFDLDTSLYDIAQQKFPGVIMLREHFRCLPEIIGWSSHQYYDGRIVCLREKAPSPDWEPVRTIYVEDGYRSPKEDANPPEAEAIAATIVELCEDARYDDMSFGVISLLSGGQARLIEDLLLDRLGPATIEDRRIRVGEAASFQGDERDVMFLSMVVAETDGRRIGAMTGAPAHRRINVAATRAREQMWVVHSEPADRFPAGDPRADLIRYCEDPHGHRGRVEDLESRCESQFEIDVLRRILQRGYARVKVQHQVGQYRIDIVIEGPGNRLAVECDGDRWHGEDVWDRDRARQQVLERAGWTFHRIRGSAFYRDPDRALEPLWQQLDGLGIPAGEWPEPPPVAVASVRLPSVELPSSEPREPSATTAADSAKSPPSLEEYGRSWDGQHDGEEETDARSRYDRAATDAPRAVTKPVTAVVREGVSAYVAWSQSGHVPGVEGASLSELADVLVEIVAAEGPMVVERAYQLCHRAGGGRRLGREIRSKLNKALNLPIGSGRLVFVDEVPGYLNRTVRLPDQPDIRVRSLGNREIYHVPRTEIRAVVALLELEDHPTDQTMRAILDFYGLRRLTTRVSEFLESCWED